MRNPATSSWVLEAINQAKQEILDQIYPVGAVYITTNSTNPGSYLGGTWSAWGGAEH